MIITKINIWVDGYATERYQTHNTHTHTVYAYSILVVFTTCVYEPLHLYDSNTFTQRINTNATSHINIVGKRLDTGRKRLYYFVFSYRV